MKEEILVVRQLPAQAADGVAQNLRQRHLDGDVDQQQPEAEHNAAGVLAEKG